MGCLFHKTAIKGNKMEDKHKVPEEDSFHKVLKKLRTELSLGMPEFCRYCGFDVTIWNAVETGLVVLSYDDLHTLNAVLNRMYGVEIWEELFHTWSRTRPFVERLPEDLVIHPHGIPMPDDNIPRFLNSAVVDVINRYHDHGLFISPNSDFVK